MEASVFTRVRQRRFTACHDQHVAASFSYRLHDVVEEGYRAFAALVRHDVFRAAADTVGLDELKACVFKRAADDAGCREARGDVAEFKLADRGDREGRMAGCILRLMFLCFLPG